MVSGWHQDQDLVDQLLDLAATITKDGVQAAAKSKLSKAASMMDAGSYAAMLLKLKVMATTLQELVLYGSSIRPTNSSEPPIKDRSAIGEQAGQVRGRLHHLECGLRSTDSYCRLYATTLVSGHREYQAT